MKKALISLVLLIGITGILFAQGSSEISNNTIQNSSNQQNAYSNNSGVNIVINNSNTNTNNNAGDGGTIVQEQVPQAVGSVPLETRDFIEYIPRKSYAPPKCVYKGIIYNVETEKGVETELGNFINALRANIRLDSMVDNKIDKLSNLYNNQIVAPAVKDMIIDPINYNTGVALAITGVGGFITGLILFGIESNDPAADYTLPLIIAGTGVAVVAIGSAISGPAHEMTKINYPDLQPYVQEVVNTYNSVYDK